MNRKTQRILASLLAIGMVSTNIVTVFANEIPEVVSEQNIKDLKMKDAKENLETIILKTKKKVEVLDYHNVFSSDIHFNDKEGITYYTLKWGNSFSEEELAKFLNISLEELKDIVSKCSNGKTLNEKEKKIVNDIENKFYELIVVVDEFGTIVNIDKFYNDIQPKEGIWGVKKLSNYSEEKLMNISYSFLDKVLEKEILDKFKKEKSEYSISYNNNYLIKIPQYDRFKAIPIEDQYILLEINKNGQVISYDLVYDKSLSFDEDFVDALNDHTRVYNLFNEYNGLTFKYKSFYNEETEEDEFIPVYEIDRDVYINAIHGNQEKVSRGKAITYNNKFEATVESESLDRVEEYGFLSSEEIKEVTQYSNLLSVNKVLQDLGNTNLLFNNFNYEVSNFYYESIKNEEKTDYLLYIDLNKIKDNNITGSVNISINAVTGKINYINSYNNEKENIIIESEYNEELIKDKVNNFLKNYNINYSEYKIDEITKLDNIATIKYARFINNVICPEDYINIRFDYKNNNIISYNYKYSDYKIIDYKDEYNKENVLNKMKEDLVINLLFITGNDLNDENKTKKSFFVYKISDADNRYYISAVDGEYLDRSGKKISEIQKKDFNIIYPDVESNMIKVLEDLYRMDIYINKDGINLYDSITVKEFEELVNKCYIYEYSRIKTDKDNDFFKREDVAEKLVNKFSYYSNIAALTGIFKTEYLDESDITEEKVGYVAIANKLGFINNDDNYFRPLDNLTYKEAFEIVYNLVK